MARKVVTVTTVTDDITTFAIDNEADVASYRITIEPLDVNGDVIADNVTTRTVDTHQKVYNAIVSFVEGRFWPMFAFLVAWYFGFDNDRADSLMAWARNEGTENDARVVKAFGGVVKTAGKGTSGKRTPKDLYVAHIRTWAIAQGIITADQRGGLKQEYVLQFVTKTGITREAFDNGARWDANASEDAINDAMNAGETSNS